MKANQTQFYLKDDTLEEKQKFFASLDVFRYHRFAEVLENGESKRKNELDAKIFRALWDATNRDIILSLYSAAECAQIMRNNLSANLTKLFREKIEEKTVTTEPDTLTDDKSIDLESLMDKMLRGEETEFTEQLAEEKPIYTEWAMQLIYCQVLLKSATDGTMILTAAKSNWERNEYQRTWRDGQYLDKFSWKGQLKDMHLFSRNNDHTDIELWVPQSTHSVFSDGNNQKVVDSCSVTVNYVGYSPIPANVEIPAKPPHVLDSHEKTINTLTLNQEKLEIFTTPTQYLQALDMVTNLFLHVEPGIKERWEREVLSRFQHQLSEDNSKV